MANKGSRTLLNTYGKVILSKKKSSQFDEIGYWSEIKLDIIKEYAQAYSRILSSETKGKFIHVYIDGFSGSGIHLSKTTGEFVPGSPLNALNIQPPFKEFHLIDLEGDKINSLENIVGSREDVFLYQGDCNKILLEKVFPKVQYKDYKRGLCLLDPYGLELSWDVIETAGTLGTIDLFLNYPVMDINRNALWRNPDKVSAESIQRMNQFWGDNSWRTVAYVQQETLFEPVEEKAANEEIAEAFQQRLKSKAKFQHVPKPLPMRNSRGAIVYYLFFASQKDVANKIVQHIFETYKYRGRH
jgi:three-Cys-motif partner protein